MTVPPDIPIAAPDWRMDPLRRQSECRAALKDLFEAMAFAAEEVGWSADETALALLRLAGAHVNERVASSMTLAAVRSSQKAFAKERRGQPTAGSCHG